MMLTGDYHQTAIAVARGVGMLPSSSQLVIIQARSEQQSTAQAPRPVPPAFNSSHSPRLPTYPVVSTFSGSRKPDGQEAGSLQLSGGKVAGGMSSRHPSFTHMCDATTVDNAVHNDPVSPSYAAQEQPSPQKSSQQQLCQQRSLQEQSCQQVLSQQPSAQQHSLHQPSYQVQLSSTSPSVSPLKVDTSQPVGLQQNTDQVVHCLQRSSCENLVFTLQREDDEEEIDAQHAITSLAQVDCPCTNCLLRSCLAPRICLVHQCACLTPLLLPCIAALPFLFGSVLMLLLAILLIYIYICNALQHSAAQYISWLRCITVQQQLMGHHDKTCM